MTPYSPTIDVRHRAEPVWQLPEELAEFVADAPEILEELLDTFLADSEVRLRIAADALQRGELTPFRKEMHSIKGAGRQVGAMALAGLCAQLEMSGPEVVAQSGEVLAELGAQFRKVMEQVSALKSASTSAEPTP